MARKKRKKRTTPRYFCRACSRHMSYDDDMQRHNRTLKAEGRCVTDNKSDKCPLGLPFVDWISIFEDDLPETIEESIEQGEIEDGATGEDMVEHYENMWKTYKIPHNEFTKEKYEE